MGAVALLAAWNLIIIDKVPGSRLLPWFLTCLGLVCLVAGFAVWRLQRWGRTLQLVITWIGAVGFPVGTIVSILLLCYLYQPGVKLLFSGRSVEDLSDHERDDLARLPRSLSGTLAIVGVVVGCLAGMIASVAIPSLLASRASANEAAALADIRTVISAQMSYSEGNGGFYDTLACLAAPARCIPGYGGPPFLEDWPDPKSGYRRTFHAGPLASPHRVREAGASPSSVLSFAYVAVPAGPGTGRRGFCGDDSGTICATRDGERPVVKEGRCAAELCRPLE